MTHATSETSSKSPTPKTKRSKWLTKLVLVATCSALVLVSLVLPSFAFTTSLGSRPTTSVVSPDYFGARFMGEWLTISNNNLAPDGTSRDIIYNDPYTINTLIDEFGDWTISGLDGFSAPYIPADRFAIHWSDLYIDTSADIGNTTDLATIYIRGSDFNALWNWHFSMSVSGYYYDADGYIHPYANTLDSFNGGAWQIVKVTDILPHNVAKSSPIVYVEEVLVTLMDVTNEDGIDVSEIMISPGSSDVFPDVPLPILEVDIVTPDVISWITSGVSAFLGSEIAPGITIGGIFMVVIAVPLVVAFLKLFAGG